MGGERIRYYRKRKKLTQEQLAKGICSVSYLSKIENGEKSSEEIIKDLCDRLGISVESVDEEKEIAEMKELLDDWYRDIRNRHFTEVQEKETDIKTKIKNIQDPQILIRYDFFKLGYQLVLKNLKLAKEQIDNLSSFEDQLTDELRHFYFHFKGFYYYLNGNFKEALAFYEQAEAASELAELDKADLAELYYHKAIAYSDLYQISSCINYTYKAFSIFEQIYHYMRSADCQILLGISNRRMHNYEQAEFHFKNGLKYAESFKDMDRLSIINHNLGYVCSSKNQGRKAIKYFQKSFVTSEPSGRKLKTIFLIARENHKLGYLEETNKLIVEGIEITKKLNILNYYYHFKIFESQIHSTDFNRFEELLGKKAIPYFEKRHQWEFVAEYSELLADLYFRESKYKKSSQYYRVANSARKRMY